MAPTFGPLRSACAVCPVRLHHALASRTRLPKRMSRGFTLIPEDLSSASTANATNAASLMEADCQRASAPRRSIRFSVELGCLLCARDVGVLECAAWPSCAGTLLCRGMPAVAVSDWHQLRCDTCGGSIIPVEVTRRWIRNEPPIDWLAERPRRGRPPKRLAAQSG